jgi:hypothetical protein
MINILNVTSYGKIIFNTNETINDVEFIIKDNDFEGDVYKIKFDTLSKGSSYFVIVTLQVVGYLKNPYIKIIHNGLEYIERFEFPTNTLKNYSLIGNSCVAWRTYQAFNNQYTSPTIGNLVLDDIEYLRFCEHIDTYCNSDIFLGETKGNENFKKQTGSSRLINHKDNIPIDYPITHHLDIEFHWIHTSDKKLSFSEGSYTFTNKEDRIDNFRFIENWKRRVERGKNTEKICLWSSSEMYNSHGNWEREQIINRFKTLPVRSIFLTEKKEEEFEDDMHIVKYIEKWEGNRQDDRSHTGVLKWNDQLENAMEFYKIIKNKFL